MQAYDHTEHEQWVRDYENLGKENKMANINTMVQSKYLKTADVPDPIIVTIRGIKQVNMAKEGDAPELKYAIFFRELDKPMILNATNIHICAKVCQSEETNDWKGKEIILYTDPNVSFGGQVVGGLRFRGQEKAPVKAAPRPTKPSTTAGLAEMPDDIPWDDEVGAHR